MDPTKDPAASLREAVAALHPQTDHPAEPDAGQAEPLSPERQHINDLIRQGPPVTP